MGLEELDRQIELINAAWTVAKGYGWVRFSSYYDWTESKKKKEIGLMMVVVRITKKWDDEHILAKLEPLHTWADFESDQTELAGPPEFISIVLAQYLALMLRDILITCTMSADDVRNVSEIIQSLILLKV